MKLRNKKTGEIISKIDVSQDHEGIWVMENKPRLYHSLAELNEEWEDYEMRELKFRAWYKPEKVFIDDAQATYDNACGGKGSLWHESFDEVLEDEDCEVEQYIGLKDKNGEEIYEGDILETPLGNRQIIFDQTLAQYVFANGEGQIGTCDDFSHWSADECHVIGNIHQNPELLKEQS